MGRVFTAGCHLQGASTTCGLSTGSVAANCLLGYCAVRSTLFAGCTALDSMASNCQSVLNLPSWLIQVLACFTVIHDN
jgi:hypothetical protein